MMIDKFMTREENPLDILSWLTRTNKPLIEMCTIFADDYNGVKGRISFYFNTSFYFNWVEIKLFAGSYRMIFKNIINNRCVRELKRHNVSLEDLQSIFNLETGLHLGDDYEKDF
jgi:hypothetical protein